MLTDRQIQNLLADGTERHLLGRGIDPAEARAAAEFIRHKGGLLQQVRAGRQYVLLSPPRLLDKRRFQREVFRRLDAGNCTAPVALDLLVGVKQMQQDQELEAAVTAAEFFTNGEASNNVRDHRASQAEAAGHQNHRRA